MKKWQEWTIAVVVIILAVALIGGGYYLFTKEDVEEPVIETITPVTIDGEDELTEIDKDLQEAEELDLNELEEAEKELDDVDLSEL
ncbi:hypothetical protein K0A96_01255 [Patescibacteria group bacterium]|nr:hypothetical protein [Patescibacteria group bacterium]